VLTRSLLTSVESGVSVHAMRGVDLVLEAERDLVLTTPTEEMEDVTGRRWGT
jgi:hypothetical protein